MDPRGTGSFPEGRNVAPDARNSLNETLATGRPFEQRGWGNYHVPSQAVRERAPKDLKEAVPPGVFKTITDAPILPPSLNSPIFVRTSHGVPSPSPTPLAASCRRATSARHRGRAGQRREDSERLHSGAERNRRHAGTRQSPLVVGLCDCGEASDLLRKTHAYLQLFLLTSIHRRI